MVTIKIHVSKCQEVTVEIITTGPVHEQSQEQVQELEATNKEAQPKGSGGESTTSNK